MAEGAAAGGQDPQLGPRLKEPVSKAERIRFFLRTAATGDASHDFQGSRAAVGAGGAAGGGSLFDEIFETYKDIGTPNQLKAGEDKLYTEFEVLDQFMNIFDGRRMAEAGQPSTFREKYLQPAMDAGGEAVIGHFQRYKEDEVPYIVTSLCLDEGKDEGTVWTRSASQLYEFLNPHEQDSVAFTIDALSVAFYDCLLRGVDNRADKTKPMKVYSLISREGINDAAGKVEIAAPKGLQPAVSIETRYDKAPYQVLYPAIDLSRDPTSLTELECFFSNYALVVSPIADVKGVTSTTLSITDKSLVRQVQVLKSSKEDRHPNAVPTLAGEIRRLYSKLVERAGSNQKEKALYHALLQQKRSGDWLQNLACLAPERFELPTDTRVMLVTNDKICAAYGIFAGVDVIFTYINPADRSKWLVRFHQNVRGNFKGVTAPGVRSPEEILKKKIELFPGPDDKISGLINYKDAKETYIMRWNETDAELKREVATAIQALGAFAGQRGGRFKPADAEKLLREVLLKETALCVFRALAPRIEGGSTEAEDMKNEGLSTEVRKAAFEKYKDNYAILQRTIEARGSAALESGELAIALFFKKIFAKNGAGTVAQKDREKLISGLQIFGTFFSKANGGANGMGIFTFLNGGLRDDEIGSLKGIIDSVYGRIEGDKAAKEKYEAFAKTASFLIKKGEAPSAAAVSNEDLNAAIAGLLMLGGGEGGDGPAGAPNALMMGGQGQKRGRGDGDHHMNGNQVENIEEEVEQLPEAGIAKKGRAGADIDALTEAAIHADGQDQVKGTFRVTDFGAATAILAARAQLELGGVAGGAARGQGGGSGQPGGGGHPEHNPLTTFHFLLRELSYRLSDPAYEDTWGETETLASTVLDLLRRGQEGGSKASQRGGRVVAAADEASITNWDYFSTLEAYLLEVGVDSSSYTLLGDIAAGIKRGYYGVNTIIDATERMKISEEEILERIAAASQSPFEKEGRLALIKRCTEEMERIPERIGALEKGIESLSTVRTPSPKSKTRKNYPAIFTSATYKNGKLYRAINNKMGKNKLVNYRTRKNKRSNQRQATVKMVR